MYKLFTRLMLMAMLCIPWVMQAQNSCTLQLLGEDEYGDGWNGGYLTVEQNGSTLITFEVEESDTAALVTVSGDSPATFTWHGGEYDDEVYIWVVNPYGDTVFYVNEPDEGVILTMASPCAMICPAPTNFVCTGSGDASSVSFTWSGGSATAWEILYGATGFDPSGTNYSTVSCSTTSYTFTTLTEGTAYDFYVRAVCSDSNSDLTGPRTVVPGQAVYNFGASGSDTLYSCAVSIFDNGGETGNYSNSTDFTLYLFPSEEGSYLELSGFSHTEGRWDYLRITDLGNGVELFKDSVSGDNSTHTFNGLLASGGVKIDFHSDGTTTYEGFRIDVSCTDSPCSAPHNLTCMGAGEADNITFNWVPGLGNTSWEIIYGAAGFDPTDDNDPDYNSIAVTDTFYTFTSLTEDVAYDVYVRAACGNDATDMIGPVTITPGQNVYVFGTSGSDTINTCNIMLVDCGGADGQYTSSNDFSLVVYPSQEGMALQITGTSYTESHYDYLEITDLYNNQIIFCDNTSGVSSTVNIGTVFAFGGAKFRFHSDSGVQYDGFQVSVTCTDAPCMAPTNLTVSNPTTESLDVEWTDDMNEGATYEVGYRAVGSDDDWNSTTTTTTSTSFTGLELNTRYEVYVFANCGDGNTDTVFATGRTLAGDPIAEFPFESDFEDEDVNANWLIDNIQGPNQWTLGTLLNNTADGSHALYVSNDGGTTHTYDNTSSSISLAYVTLDMEPGEYTISFDWMTSGESSYDYIRAGLVPVDAEITSYTMPSGSITIADMLNGQDSWQTFYGEFTVSTSGVYKLVFMWRNDYIQGNNPPGALDNVILSQITCPVPSNLVCNDFSNASNIQISWNGGIGNSSWDIVYGPMGFNPEDGDGTEITVYDSTYTFTGLTQDEPYHIYVRSNCGGGDVSDLVGPITVTPGQVVYTMQSTGIDTLLTCNAVIVDDGGISGNYSSNCESELYLFPSTEGDGLMLTGFSQTEGSYDYLEITDLASGAVVFQDNASSNNSAVQLGQLIFTNGAKLRFHSDVTVVYPGFEVNVICIDIPDCETPTALQAVPQGTDTLLLSWTGTAGSFTVAYGPAGINPDTVATNIVTTSNMQVTFDWLTGGQAYDFYVRGECGGESSFWAGPVQGATGIYAMPTSGVTSLTTCGAVITDDGGIAGQYSNSVDATLYVYPSDPNMVVQISGNINTESGYDSVYIYEGIGTTGNVILSASGITTLQPTTSLSGPVTIVFHTDGSSVRNGFELYVSCVTPPDCYPVTTLALMGSSSTDITVGWNGPQDGDFELSFNDGTNTTTQILNGVHTYNFTGLTPQTTYTISVGAICDDEVTAVQTLTVTTPMVGADLPVNTGFEVGQDTSWTVANGVNAWSLGSATANGGSRAFYISNDNGTHNAYTISTSSYSYLYKTINITDAGEYEYSFDWIANGESSYDYLRVFLAPSSVTSFGGDNGISSSGTPSGWIALDGGSKLNLSTEWQSFTGSVDVAVPSTYLLLFYWHNDGSVGNQPPAAVDNVVFQAVSCPRPSEIVVDNVGLTSVDFHWTDTNATSGNYVVTYGNVVDYTSATYYSATNLSPATNYTLAVRRICAPGDTSLAVMAPVATLCGDVATPYFNDFEGYPAGSGNFPNCWTNYSATSNYIQANYGVGNSQALHFQGPGVVITPRIAIPGNRIVLSASLRAESTSSSGTMHIGFTTDPIGMVDYVDIAEFQPQTSHFAISDIYFDSATADTGYVVFRQDPTASSVWYWWLDDLLIDDMGTCPKPTDLTASGATQNSVDLSWNDRGNQTQWIIEYGPMGFTPGTGTSVLASSNPYTLSGLAASYQGDFYVRALCGIGDTSNSQLVPGHFATSQVPATLPYDYNFEAATEWNAWQTASNNSTAWYRGTTVAGAGQYSMFVSNDGTSFWNYSNSQVVNAVAYRDIDLGNVDSSYTLSFMARAGGSTSAIYDGLLVAVVDPSTPVIMTDDVYTTPWGVAGEFEYLSLIRLDTVWSNYEISIDTTSGVKRLVFYWFNSTNNYSSLGQAAAVDNIHLDYSTCPRPLATTVGSVGSSSAQLSWQGPAAAQYLVAYADYPAMENVQWASTSTNSIVLSGLTELTQYAVWVFKNCGGDTSISSDGILFSTSFCDGGVEFTNFDANASSTTTSYSPIGYSYYNYSYVQSIVPAANMEFGAADISALAFNTVSGSGGNYFTGMTVYLANVSENDLSAGFIMPDSAHQFTRVIEDADFGYTDGGWHIQTFDSVFAWDGQSNILVAVERHHGDYASGSSFTAHTDTLQRTRYFYSDLDEYDVYTAEGGTPTTTVGDLKLYSCGAGCPKPGMLYASNVTYQGATMNWSGLANGYEVAWKSVLDAVWPAETSVGNATSYSVSGLQPATTYQFRVRSLCDEGMQSDWTELVFTTDSLPCFAPGNVSVVETGYTTATLDWENGGNEAQWTIHVWNTNFDTTYVVDSHPATVGGMLQNMTYNATVSSNCGDGSVMSEPSEEISFTTDMCEQVQNLTVANVMATQAYLTWEGSSSTYEVDYGGLNHGQGTGIQVTVTGNSVTLTGLEPDMYYSAFVRAICEPGIVGPWSQQVDFLTPEQNGIDDDFENGTADVVIYPNPASESTTIALSGVNGEVTVTVVNMNGRTVRSETLSCTGNCQKHLEVDALAQGAYFVRVSGEGVNMVRKLIVK